MATFHDLTAELMDLLVSFMNEQTFCNFRLLSRECRDRSLQDMSRRIAQVPWLVTAPSLNTLHTILENQQLARKICRLHIVTQGLGDAMQFDSLARGVLNATNEAERLAATMRNQKFQEHLEAQTYFRKGDDGTMLTMVLSRLPALQTLQLGDCCIRSDTPDYWRRQTFVRETGLEYISVCIHEEQIAGEGQDSFIHNFKAVLRALSLLKVRIKHLTAGQWEDGVPLGQIVISKMEQWRSYFSEGLRVSFSNLRTMDLYVRS